MNTQELITLIIKNPVAVHFDDVITVINNEYQYSPVQFKNGSDEDYIINDAGSNEGSCKIFAFAELHDLNEAQTLACFGKYYRQDVLLNLSGIDHANIRNFMKYGWDGILFERNALTPC